MKESCQSMKRVLIISYFFYPSTAVGARRIYNLQKYLSKFGVSTDVLTVKASAYPEIDKKLESVEENVFRSSTLGPVKVTNRGEGETFLAGLLRRSRYVLSKIAGHILFPDEYVGWFPFALTKGMRLLKTSHYDLIISSGHPWSVFMIGDWLSRLTGVPHVMDYRDPWTAYDNNWFPSKLKRAASNTYEKGLVKRANKIIVNTKAVEAMFKKEFGNDVQSKIKVIRNGFDEEVAKLFSEETLPPRIQRNKFRLVHTGMFYRSRNLGTLLQAIRVLRDEKVLSEINFELISFGALTGNDNRYIESNGLKDLVCECKYKSYQESLEELSCGSMLLLAVGADHGPMVPAKFFDYLMVRRPIFCLGPEQAEVKDMMSVSNRGLYCHIYDEGNVEKTLREAFNNWMTGEYDSMLPEASEFSISFQVKELIKFIFPTWQSPTDSTKFESKATISKGLG